MVKIVIGEGLKSQMSIVGMGGDFLPSPGTQIICGFHLVNCPLGTGGYFLWGKAVGEGLQSLAYCRG
jgi:hypothetical protein